jgi:hypothetical protein
VIAVLIPDGAGRRAVVALAQRFDERDALLAVEDVQGLPLVVNAIAGTIEGTEHLVRREVDTFFLTRCILPLDDFAHPLAGGIVRVVHAPTTAEAGRLQLVLGVEPHLG